MKMKLEIQDRKSDTGKKMVAPYINDWCVWDIPVKEWTPSVAEAVMRAYALGAQHMKGEINETVEAPSALNAVWGQVA
jgi:hypothetical protein